MEQGGVGSSEVVWGSMRNVGLRCLEMSRPGGVIVNDGCVLSRHRNLPVRPGVIGCLVGGGSSRVVAAHQAARSMIS
jgi:hypothetical protein